MIQIASKIDDMRKGISFANHDAFDRALLDINRTLDWYSDPKNNPTPGNAGGEAKPAEPNGNPQNGNRGRQNSLTPEEQVGAGSGNGAGQQPASEQSNQGQQPKPKRKRNWKTTEEIAREMYADYDAERGLGIRPDGTYGIVDAVRATEYQQKLETEKAEAEKALETAKGKSAKTWTERLKVLKENIRKMNYHFKKFRRLG